MNVGFSGETGMEKDKSQTEILLLVFSLVAAVSWPAKAAKADELSDLKEQLSDLQNRTAQLEAQQKLKEKSLEEQIEELKKQENQAKPNDFRVYWKEGLNFATLDENFKLKIGGRLQTDWFWSSEDTRIKQDVGDQEDGVEVRRARLYFSGLIYGNVEYKLQFDFAGGEAALKDAYLALPDFPLGELQMGHFKEPFSLEELTSSKYITFLERALPNAFAPSRNMGFMLHHVASDERMTAAIGLFRDTDDFGEGVDDGEYNVTGRVTALPIYQNKGANLLHLGAAYSCRNPDDTIRYSQRPEAHLAHRFVDTGTFGADQADLVGLEAAWVDGPLSLQSEYIMAYADRPGASNVDFDGYYVQASYFLTGEHRNYKTSEAAFSRIKPNRNYGAAGGPGAWEIAARYSGIDLNDNGVAGGQLNDVTAGLNWYLNPNTRIMWNYVHADKDDVGQGDVLMMRLQFDF
jgi:phosphate-selective porin OprO/OprP